MYIENIVVGMPIVEPAIAFSFSNKNEDEMDNCSYDIDDWETTEKEKTYFTNERFLPRILVDIGIYPSVSEIRRNKPELMVTLDKIEFIDCLKVSKKHKVWILVGE